MSSTILSLISAGLMKTIRQVCSTVKSVIKYLTVCRNDKIEEKKEDQKKKDDKKIDEICNKGTLGDLLDWGSKVILLVSSTFVSFTIVGCIDICPQVQTTKQWENHYMTVQEFQIGTKDMKLEKGESVWVISNSTLSRLLKNFKDN